MSFNSFQVGPHSTPKIIKIIISLTIICSLLSATLSKDFLYNFLGLSTKGINHSLYFQLLTNLFLIPDKVISFGFVINLLFNSYIIWVFGSAIIELKGLKHFVFLSLLSGVFSSLIALYAMSFSPFFIFSGSTILIYSFSMAWLILHSDAKILLFFTLPFNAKWLILGAMGINLLSLLSSEQYVYFFSYLSAAFIAYLYGLFIWQKHGPMNFLKKIEKKLLHLLQMCKFKNKKNKAFHPSKIYDFNTKEPVLNDEEFMDAMLAKITLYGEDILSFEEKKRMDEISKKKPK